MQKGSPGRGAVAAFVMLPLLLFVLILLEIGINGTLLQDTSQQESASHSINNECDYSGYCNFSYSSNSSGSQSTLFIDVDNYIRQEGNVDNDKEEIAGPNSNVHIILDEDMFVNVDEYLNATSGKILSLNSTNAANESLNVTNQVGSNMQDITVTSEAGNMQDSPDGFVNADDYSKEEEVPIPVVGSEDVVKNVDELVNAGSIIVESADGDTVRLSRRDIYKEGKGVKISRELYDVIYAKGGKEKVIVRYSPSARPKNIPLKHNAVQVGSVQFGFTELDNETLLSLVSSGIIEEVYKDIPMSISLEDSAYLIGAEIAHTDMGVTGEGIAICLLDTGVNPSEADNVFEGYDFVNGDSDPSDDNGHGTRMAKVINAIAPDAKIIPVKVLDSSGTGYSSAIIQGISYCMEHASEHNIRVISMSFGGGQFTGYCEFDPVVMAADGAYSTGISVVASSGNDGAAYITAPACGRNVTAVAATTKDDTVASFSNINGMVDLLAPGEGIIISDRSYSGTSISAAMVSASYALLYSYNSSVLPADAERLLKTSGTFVEHSGNTYTRIDVYNALMGIYTGEPTNQTVNQTQPGNYTYSYSAQEYNSVYNAIIAYRSNTGSGLNFPKIRFWNSTGEGSWGPEIQLPTAGSPVRWAVVKWSPISSKIVLVTLSDDGYLDGYVCMGNCTNVANWQVTNNIGQVWTTAAAQRRFDVGFETATGDAVVVYGVLSAVTTRDLAYRVLPASSSSFATTTEQYIDDTGHATDIQYSWVRLARNPRVGQEEIILVGFD
ncbi:MAG: S8 family serine peptidase, partial [Candidatus Micrarchaeia archaeon]